MPRPDSKEAVPAPGVLALPLPLAAGQRGSPPLPTMPLLSVARLTQEGWWWLLASGALWATALVKGINLLTLLATLMAVIWLLNFWLAGRRLRYLRCTWRLDRPVFAQIPFGVDVQVRNMHRAAQVGLLLENRGPDHVLRWFVTRLGGGETTGFHGETLLPRRGWHTWPALQISSSYPFGLAERRGQLATDGILVFPRLDRLHRGRLRRWLTEAAACRSSDRSGACHLPAAQTHFHGLRAFRTGDSPRWIHWRTSARRGELMVREFEDPLTANLVLILEPWRPASRRPQTDNQTQDDADADTFAPLEQAVSLAATICWEWCRQKGDHLVLAVAGRAPVVVQGLTGSALALLMLECLALVEGTPEPNAAQLAERLQATPLPTAAWLVVSTHPSNLAEHLAGRFHRPVPCVDVSACRGYDFFERAPDHAS